MKSVAILGSGLAGNLMASYLRTMSPELEVTIIGPKVRKTPIVGESLIEFSTHMLYRLGLAGYLEDRHLHKYGLSFYYKENPDSPECRRYIVHEGPAAPPMPSKQLNRFTFDPYLEQRNLDMGVVAIDAKVRDVRHGSAARWIVEFRRQDGTEGTSDADWVVDATGRRRFLVRKHELQEEVAPQRSACWIRVRGFDRQFLGTLEAIKPPQHVFDPYFATQHFLSHGAWVWCIPLQGDSDEPLMSVGLTWRPDLVDHELRTPEELIAAIGARHPVVADGIRAGTVDDFNVYRNYLYGCRQIYSPEGWFAIGDAGCSVDPLYSTGLATTSVQIQQVHAMIRREREDGRLDPAYVRDLQDCYFATTDTFQRNIARQYEWMGDPYQVHWSIHLQTMFYFYFALPCWLAGYHMDPVGARLMTKIFVEGRKDYDSIMELVAVASRRSSRPSSEDIHNHYDRVVNWNLWGPAPQEVSMHIARMLRLYADFRHRLLQESGGHRRLEHYSIMARDRSRAWLLDRLTRGRSLLELDAVRRFVGTGPLYAVTSS